MKQKYNFHTHTYRCQHASGDIDDYCKVAVDLGMTDLGFSDHTPLPNGEWPKVRMSMDQLSDYCSKIDQAKEKFPSLTIFKGLECEFDLKWVGYFQDILLGKYQMQYLVGSVHWFPHRGNWINAWKAPAKAEYLSSYSKYIIDIMDSGLFQFIAHPDLFAAFYPEEDQNSLACAKDIIVAATELDIPLEINGYGFQKTEVMTSKGSRKMYPWMPFWKIARDFDLKVVANSDAHKPLHVYGCINDAIEIAEQNNLKLIKIL